MHAANKKAVVSNLREIFRTPMDQLQTAVAAAYAEDAQLFAFHPVNEHVGSRDIADALWRPIRESFPDLERRDQIVIAGEYKGNEYVSAMGQLQGTFATDLFDVPASHGTATLRYGEIHRVANGKIVESHVLVDMLDLMFQADCWPISPSLGAEGACCAPATLDGVNVDVVDADKGKDALALVKKMHAGLLSFDGKNIESMDHQDYWTPDFLWYGPAGIGTTRGLEGFRAHHQIPFLRAFPDRKVANHIANVGDGDYVITGGWPSVVATHTGPDWLNLGPTDKRIEMRVMDFYRVEDGLIAENWVPIDIIDILLQIGVDVFQRLRHLTGRPRMTL